MLRVGLAFLVLVLGLANASVISNIFPTYGSVEGGTILTIRGTGFMGVSYNLNDASHQLCGLFRFFRSGTIVCDAQPIFLSSVSYHGLSFL